MPQRVEPGKLPRADDRVSQLEAGGPAEYDRGQFERTMADHEWIKGVYVVEASQMPGDTADENTVKISVNLQGYNNTPLAVNNGWFQIGGWSEKIFDLIEAMLKPGDAVKLINNIDF